LATITLEDPISAVLKKVPNNQTREQIQSEVGERILDHILEDDVVDEQYGRRD